MGGTGGGLSDADAAWETYPEESYYKALGIPVMGGTPYQKWLAQQYDPTYTAWQSGNVVPGASPYSKFSDYLTSIGVSGARNQVGNMFNSLLNQAPEQERTWIDTIGTDNFANLLEMATKNKYGYNPVSNRLASGLAGQYNMGQLENFNNPNYSFLGYLRKKYGI